MVTAYQNICAICGRPKEHTHHLVFGRGIRNLADEDGLTIPLCSSCHSWVHLNSQAGCLSKMIGQLEWEKDKIIDGSDPDKVREMFRERYGRSYL